MMPVAGFDLASALARHRAPQINALPQVSLFDRQIHLLVPFSAMSKTLTHGPIWRAPWVAIGRPKSRRVLGVFKIQESWGQL